MKNDEKTAVTNIYEDIIFQNFTHSTFYSGSNQTQDGKDAALSYIEKQQDQLFLYSEDKSTKGNKRFYTLNFETVHTLAKQKKYHIYEHFEAKDPIKLFIDIDVYTSKLPRGADPNEHLDSLITDTIDAVNKEAKSFDVADEDLQVIVLKSSRPEKLSAHIIYSKLYFENIQHLKYFMTEIKAPIFKCDVIDLSVYKIGCLRLLWCSKMQNNVNLEYYKGINYELTNDKQLFMDCLVRNITDDCQRVDINMPSNVKLVHKKIPVVIKGNTPITQRKYTVTPAETVITLLNLIKSERMDDYNFWIKCGMATHNCNPTSEGFEAWNAKSAQSPNYSGRDMCAYKWNSFKFGNLGIATLKYFAKMDNPEKFEEFIHSPDKRLFETIKFEKDYLIDVKKGECIKQQNYNNNIINRHTNRKIGKGKYKEDKIVENPVCLHLRDWLEDDNKKTLAIKSPYDTGKTTIIRQIIREYNPKRILFTSHRQTFTMDLYGGFKRMGKDEGYDFKVCNYLDGTYMADRIICQLESLNKLKSGYVFDDDYVAIPGFDIVIMDESESLINHVKSPTLGVFKEEKFNLLVNIIKNSKKLLLCDSDFYNRSYEFMKQFDDNPIILENIVKKNQKHFIFMNNRKAFDNMITEDLKNGKNVVVASLSASIARGYFNKFNGVYQSMLHCSDADDSLKKKLKNVADFWKKFQFLCYSPFLDAGVDFSVKHFDDLYVVLSNKSCSPRALMQMCSRVRKYTNSNVHVFLNRLPFIEKANMYSYSEVKEYMMETNNSLCHMVAVEDKKTGLMVYRKTYKFGLYEKMMVYNEQEHLNKLGPYFVPMLIRLLVEKGHTYEFKDMKPMKGTAQEKINKGDEIKKNIMEAQDINHETYLNLLNKQRRNDATEEDKMKIKRYIIKRDWKVVELTEKFMTDFYGKTHILFNLRYLLGKKELELTICDSQTYGDLINYDAIKISEQKEMIIEVLDALGFDDLESDLNNKKRVDKETFDANIKTVLVECDLFVDLNKSQPLFDVHKMKLGKGDYTTKAFMGLINSILKEWGIKIKSGRNKTNRMIKGVKTPKRFYFYQIMYSKGIDKYI